LYQLERPESFILTEVVAPEVSDLVRRFAGIPIGNPKRVAKCNPRSAVYSVSTAEGRLIVKSTDLSLAHRLEAQCAIACAAAETGLIQPLSIGEGSFVIEEYGQAWIVYQAAEGEIYDGKNLPLDALMLATWDLIAHLRSLSETDRIESWSHRPGIWRRSLTVLTNASVCGDVLAKSGIALAPSTVDMLVEHSDLLGELVTNAVVLAEQLVPAIVHNDLQHANILASRGTPIFLDLEDICREAPQIALTHGLFKVVRHCVYCGAESRHHARERLPRILERMAAHPAWDGAQATAFDYAALRIISDISETLAPWIEDRVPGGLYDLEKRIHNLFELIDLFRGRQSWI